jgi:hypothetical protein
MLEIKQKISQAFRDNTYAHRVLNIWRKQEHPLGLDKPFIEGVEASSCSPAVKNAWRSLRTSLAEYSVAEKMSDWEFIEKLADHPTQEAFVRWVWGPLERREGESDKDFEKREGNLHNRFGTLMNYLARAGAVGEYAETPEALEKVEA